MQPAERLEAARRALDLLDRDLLPRSAGGDTYLVCGIVGPNNAGKSALFNSLLGRDLSPSVPAGGATRRLVGAASPELLARLEAEPSLARFHLRPLAAAASRLQAALEPAPDPAELLLVADPSLPPSLLLIDTPDFDSILQDNRFASESLLAVADLVIAVVTRHSYQNREVVHFLRSWLDHGRPWMLLYNEAIDEEVARAHAAKLIADVGHPPLAELWAPHSLAVQDGSEPLIARRLPASPGAAADLRAMLFDLQQIAELKSRAVAASLARLRGDLDAVTAGLAEEAAQGRELWNVAAIRAAEVGREVALAAMPAGPFVQAFRAVLDRRSNPLSRSWRTLVRGFRLRLEDVAGLIWGRSRPPAGADGAGGLDDIEKAALRQAWPEFWEELARDLGPEARHPARRVAPPRLAALLDADLAEANRLPALERAAAALQTPSADLTAFENACADVIEQAIEERGFDIDIQAAADLATLAPLALAAAVIVNTGGVGVDLAIAGGGAVGTFLMEKYSHLLGSGILAEARRRWADLRGGHIAAQLAQAALAHSGPALGEMAHGETAVTAELRRLRQRIAQAPRPPREERRESPAESAR